MTTSIFPVRNKLGTWAAVTALLFWYTAVAGAEGVIPPSPDTALTHLLNNGEQVARTESGNWIVRVYKMYDLGECGPDRPESCPLRQIMVAIRTIDLAPDQAVYVLPKAHDWRFVEWTHVPKRDGPDDFVRFTLERDDPSRTPEAGWWTTTRQEVAVNPWKASIRPLAP